MTSVVIDQQKRFQTINQINEVKKFINGIYKQVKNSPTMMMHEKAYEEDLWRLPYMIYLLDMQLEFIDLNTVEGVYVAAKYYNEFYHQLGAWMEINRSNAKYVYEFS